MTITVTRTTEFQKEVNVTDDELPAAIDMVRMEANHHSAIIDEQVTVDVGVSDEKPQ